MSRQNSVRHRILIAAEEIAQVTQEPVTTLEVVEHIRKKGFKYAPSRQKTSNILRGVFDRDANGGYIVDLNRGI